ncbi:MAG: hypothetical protein H0W13_12140 [Nitrospirales bacterium]|nr:hypothetical protein [Nitrospirales bacterium]
MELQNAARSAHCSLFGISNKPLGADLAALAHRGVEVEVSLDRLQAAGKSDLHTYLEASGVRVEIKHTLILEHNKFCVLDGKTVIVGSWNWSKKAQKQTTVI